MSAGPSEDLPEPIAARLTGVIAARTDEQSTELKTLCREYPDLAERIRQRIAEIRKLGGQIRRTFDAPDEDPEWIGPYRVLGRLGQGGFGTVYLAERRAPVRMRVALKVVKLGMDTELILRRFAVERQAIALMEHASIAKVLDAGATESGRPYFAMEYVKGEPVTAYCDGQRLPLRDRLEVFLDICAGVQHAHQKSVIHRDLTPNNVLITVQDVKPVPKIIDFGLARAMNGQLLEQTVYTEIGRFIGTPEYMSPEQASYGRLDVDARTDVYSLGVLLFELLTGSPPLRRRANEGLDEIRERIVTTEPPRPSMRLSALNAWERHEIARLRGISVSEHRRALKGDLDWITLKALAKDRTQRYPTPAALADDVRRHLDDLPVEAGPPSLRYQLGKLIRRHRRQFAAAAVLLLALLAGGIGTTVFWVQASHLNNRLKRTLADYEKLLDTARVASLEYRAARAHPPDERQIGELESLIRLADTLVATIPAVDAATAELADRHLLARAVPRPPERGVHPEFAELAHILGLIEAIDGELLHPRTTDDERELGKRLRAELSAARDAIQHRMDYSHRVAISEPKARLLFDRFERQRVDLCRVRDQLLPDLRFRLEWARNVRRVTVDEPSEAWEAFRKRMQASTVYAGLTVGPQVGLVPIGPDPVSKLEEFGHLLSGGVPSRDGSSKLRPRSKDGLVFVLLPAGKVRVGAHDLMRGSARDRIEDTAIAPLFMSKFEMNRLQWQRLARGVPGLRLFHDALADLRNLSGRQTAKPANGVTWEQCNRLLLRSGLELPSQAEWEYACKAGTETFWYTGNTLQSLGGAPNNLASPGRGCAANFRDGTHRPWWAPQAKAASYFDGFAGPNNAPRLAPAHYPLRPNAFGLYHMLGNVAEWCADAPVRRRRVRALRGGSCNDSPYEGYTTFVNKSVSTDASVVVGLRPIRRLAANGLTPR